MYTNTMSINVSRTDKYFNEEEVGKLLSSITVLEDRALIAFGIDTGLRVSEVVGNSGFHFRWKDLRPTFAQICRDKGMPIELISKMLRHTNVATTEKYYARIRSEVAFEKFERMWEQPIVSVQKVAD